jgi:hypothetical protein
MKMKLGAANYSNTYFCNDCHVSGGRNPAEYANITASFRKDVLRHGSTNCQWCHIAGDPLSRPLSPEFRYHPNGPKGTASGKSCLNCHVNPTIFNAPLITHYDDEEYNECRRCHDPADNHRVTPDPWLVNPPNVISLSVTTPVSSGTGSQIQATISGEMVRMAAARYQVTNNSGVVIDWTEMNPISGFEFVNANIDTSRLLGNYNVNVMGMAWAPKVDGSRPYYPFNGQWSQVSTVQLNVTQTIRYVNGTVSGSLGNIPGAMVSTNTSISTTTNSTGFFSLRLPDGIYMLTASKEPEYYANSSVIVNVTAFTTLTQDIILTPKPTGTIKGNVTNK